VIELLIIRHIAADGRTVCENGLNTPNWSLQYVNSTSAAVPNRVVLPLRRQVTMTFSSVRLSDQAPLFVGYVRGSRDPPGDVAVRLHPVAADENVAKSEA